ncbi:MAG: HD domain-containing protein [Clostridiaceae bacterium]|nr:HD domain-containing protein [Clostridiaceae bacterium]
MVTDYIRGFVKEECNKNQLTRELYDNHILVVVDYGARLGRLLEADPLVLELACYLHDFSPHHNFEHKNSHNFKSSKSIEDLLSKFKFPKQIIEQVCETISANANPARIKNATKEQICLFNAEAMSLLAKPVFWLYYSNSIRENKMTHKDNLKVYIDWIEYNWNNMISEARDMMAEEYSFVQKLVNK